MNDLGWVDRPSYLDVPPGKSPPSSHTLVEPKGDGHWVTVVVRNNHVSLVSRTGRVEFESPTRAQVPDMRLIGEHMFGTAWSGSRPERVQLFDALEVRGEDLRARPLRERRKRLEQLALVWLPAVLDGLVVLPQYPSGQWATLWDDLVEKGGWEGLVFKNADDPFGAMWARMKRRATMDYVCMGIAPGGKGTKYEHVGGTVLGGLYNDKEELELVSSVGGLTEAQRIGFWVDRDAMTGRVFEAGGSVVFPSGALRHPNFLRWRDDKPARQCVRPTAQGGTDG